MGSWLAALQMTGEKWTANSVPSRFVKASVEAACGSFADAAREAAQSSARPAVRDPLRRLIAESRAASDLLRRAAAAQDRASALPVVQRLAALRARFTALAQAGQVGER